MKRILLLVVMVFIACKNDTIVKENISATVESVVELDTAFEVYDYDGLEPLINKKDDKVHVVNFWATWCAPCVKELPYFETINENYNDKGVEVLLVSLDFPKDYDKKLKPFLKDKNIKSKVVALDDTNMDRWLRMINKDWSGALPATIIYKGNKRQFYERSFTQQELETELKQFLSL